MRPETPRKTTETNTDWVGGVSRLRKGSSIFERRCISKIKSIIQFQEHFHGDIRRRTRGNGETRGAGTYFQDVPDPSHNQFVVLQKGQKVSRVHCRECDSKFYTAESSALATNGIGDIPLFTFVAYCFSLRISQKAIVALAGCDVRTVNKYQNALRQALCSSVDAEKRAGNLVLGGVGKTVEVDEAFVSKRKYEAEGRRPRRVCGSLVSQRSTPPAFMG